MKALLASESGYGIDKREPKNGKAGKARGPMQLTDETLRLMDGGKGGPSDYLVHLSHEEAREPNLAIAGAIRWLFQKKAEAKEALKREPTWTETVVFYKGYKKQYLKKTPIEKMKGLNVFGDAFKRLTGKAFGK